MTKGGRHDDQTSVSSAHEADLFRLAHLFDDRKNLTPRMVRTGPGQILNPNGMCPLHTLHDLIGQQRYFSHDLTSGYGGFN